MRKALGRGLDALIPTGEDRFGNSGDSHIKKVPLASIRPNHLQPRKHFDPEKLSGLAASIKEHGLAQPIVVSHDFATDSYELIAGERRLRASQLAGHTEIEVLIKNPNSERERLALALIENLQREDLNPIEEALGYLRLMKEFGLTQTMLSQTIGKSKSAVSNTLRLLDLPEEIQKALQHGQLSEGHARALLSLENPIEKHKLFQLTLEQNLSVRDVENYCKRLQGGEKLPEKDTPPRIPRSKPADVKALEDSLQQILSTRVELRTRKDGNRGTITLHYYSLDDFERLVNILKK